MLYCKPLVDQTKSVQNTLIFNYEIKGTVLNLASH